MTEIVFVFSFFIQLFRIFSLRIHAGYAMRFTFKVRRAEQKERAKNCAIKASPSQAAKKAPYAAHKNSPIKALLADSIKKPHTPQDGQSILCV